MKLTTTSKLGITLFNVANCNIIQGFLSYFCSAKQTHINKPFPLALHISFFLLLFNQINITILQLNPPVYFQVYKMGMSLSFLGKGLPSTQMIGFVMGTLYKQFVERDIRTFEEFHIAILDIFNTFNSSLPGKHYDAPSRTEVQQCFSSWKDAKSENEKKECFINFMKNHVILSKLDDSAMVTGVVTPPAAMAAKKAAEKVPQLKLIKHVPDVVFVPAATVLALVAVKLTRKMFLGNLASP